MAAFRGVVSPLVQAIFMVNREGGGLNRPLRCPYRRQVNRGVSAAEPAFEGRLRKMILPIRTASGSASAWSWLGLSRWWPLCADSPNFLPVLSRRKLGSCISGGGRHTKLDLPGFMCSRYGHPKESAKMTAIHSIPDPISRRIRFRSQPVNARAIKVVIPTYKDCLVCGPPRSNRRSLSTNTWPISRSRRCRPGMTRRWLKLSVGC